MSEQNIPVSGKSKSERVKVWVRGGSLAAVVGLAVGGGVAAARHNAAPTHEQHVSATFEGGINTNDQMVTHLREMGAQESRGELLDELHAAEPGHNDMVQPGQTVEMTVDMPTHDQH